MPGSTPSPQEYSSLVDEVVTQQFMRGEWDNTKEIHAIFEELDRAGRIRMDGKGKFIEQKARVGRYQKGQRADLEDRNWSRKQHRITYTCGWSFHEVLGVISERDKMFLQSGGPEVIVDTTADMLSLMGQDFTVAMNDDVMKSNAGSNAVFGQAASSSSETPLQGLPTIFEYGSAAQDYDHIAKTTSGAIGAGDKEALPQATYCGVNTNPTATLSGVDDAVTEATSPILANWSSTAWDGSSTSWEDNCLRVLSHMINRQTRGNGSTERPNIGFLDQDMFSQLKTKMRSDTTQQVVLTDSPTSPDVGMHPRLWVPFEGLRMYQDLDAPDDTVYVLNTNYLWFRIFPQQPAGFTSGGSSTAPLKGNKKEMFSVAQSPDINQGGHKVVATLVCQLIGNPRYQGAAFDFA